MELLSIAYASFFVSEQKAEVVQNYPDRLNTVELTRPEALTYEDIKGWGKGGSIKPEAQNPINIKESNQSDSPESLKSYEATEAKLEGEQEEIVDSKSEAKEANTAKEESRPEPAPQPEPGGELV